MPPKKERDEVLAELSSRIFNSMMEELLMDVVLQSHKEIARSKAVCKICHTRCHSVHVPGPSNPAQAGSSARPSPPDGSKSADSPAGSQNGTNTPNGNVYFECTNCNRQIASNRYAPHLSSCMGLGNSRRGAVRATTSKSKDTGRSASPYVGSENGNVSDDSKGTSKGKAKSKAKRVEEAEFSLNGNKRKGSPAVSPVKKTKKQKTGSPLARVRTSPDISTTTHPAPTLASKSMSKIPSKLRESSVVSLVHRDKRSESPDSASSPEHSASTPSVRSMQSPVLAGAGIPGRVAKNGKPTLNGASHGRASPPRPIPPVFRPPSPPDYLVDVEGDGEETGSSTDDSD